MGNALSSKSKNAFAYAQNDYQLVIEVSKEFEFLLEKEFGAEGKGLHEKISGASPELPPPTIKSLRYIASVRNSLVHDRDVKALKDRALFILKCESAMEEIQVIVEKKRLDAKGGGTFRGSAMPDSCQIM